jgi:hypothetical protein
MAANLLSVNITSFNGVSISGLVYAVNKNRINQLYSLDSGANSQLDYTRNYKVNKVDTIVSSDNYSVVLAAIDGANQYTAGNKFEATVTNVGASSYGTPTDITLSTDSIVYVQENPSDSSKSIIIYEDPSQGEISIYANETVAAIITATTT